MRSNYNSVSQVFPNYLYCIFEMSFFFFLDPSKMVSACQTKAVYGLSACPDNDFQLASFFEYQIAIWDLRRFDKPLLTVQKNKPVWKISWCPTR